MSVQPVGDSSVTPGVPVRLADLDRELLAAIPAAERDLADRLQIATRHRLPAGPWIPAETVPDQRSADSALLLHGMIVRDVMFGGWASGQVFGAGDILRPWRATDTSLPVNAMWQLADRWGVVRPEGVIVRLPPVRSATVTAIDG